MDGGARESAELAKRLIADTCEKQDIQPGQLTIHADRGSSMRSKPVAFLLADLAVIKSHSRPYVSDDNPYSESHFRTLKYRPDFPDRFGSIEDSRAFCQKFFAWYNEEHRHSGIELLTPSMVHYGQAGAVIERRRQFVVSAFEKYLAMVGAALKKYDANHLNLGIRFGGNPPDYISKAARVFDVYSLNTYEYEPTRQVKTAYELSGRPESSYAVLTCLVGSYS